MSKLIIFCLMITNFIYPNQYIIKVNLIHKKEIGRRSEVYFLLQDLNELNAINLDSISIFNDTAILNIFQNPIIEYTSIENCNEIVMKVTYFDDLFKNSCYKKVIESKDFLLEYKVIYADFTFCLIRLKYNFWPSSAFHANQAFMLLNFKKKNYINHKSKKNFKHFFKKLKLKLNPANRSVLNKN